MPSQNLYLKRAEELGIDPNFYMSDIYLILSQVKVHSKNNYIWLEDEDWVLFPPLPEFDNTSPVLCKRIWVDYPECKFSAENYIKTFFDFQYIYDPKVFSDLSGGKWEVFRKNIKKWPKINKGWFITHIPIDTQQTRDLLAEWLEKRQSSIYDPLLIARYSVFSESPLISRRYLYNEKRELMAINAWDYNWKYINYRVCITKSNQPFLEEFARFSFYTDEEVIKANKLVNDGGVLNDAGLKRFKDKLNPIKRVSLHSYELKF